MKSKIGRKRAREGWGRRSSSPDPLPRRPLYLKPISLWSFQPEPIQRLSVSYSCAAFIVISIIKGVVFLSKRNFHFITVMWWKAETKPISLLVYISPSFSFCV